jgi:hypothetical protein
MHVLVRHKTNDKGIRRRRSTPGGISASRGEESRPSDTSRSSDTAEFQLPTATNHDGSPARRQQQSPVQDSAFYSCRCGYAFQALVSTSVDCPHCGDGQAW